MRKKVEEDEMGNKRENGINVLRERTQGRVGG